MKTRVALTFALLSVDVLSAQTITGKDAFADYSQQKPGISRKITVADLPEPNPSQSVDNGVRVVARPEGMLPIAPAGLKGHALRRRR